MNDDMSDNLSEADIRLFKGYLTFTEHYAQYIKQNNEDLHKRATDFALTFTNEDIPGLRLSYIKDKNENRKD